MGRRTGQPQPHREISITQMRNGAGVRVECGCGWWLDTDTWDHANYAGNAHRNQVCAECLAWAQRVNPSTFPSAKRYAAAMRDWHRKGHTLPQ